MALQRKPAATRGQHCRVTCRCASLVRLPAESIRTKKANSQAIIHRRLNVTGLVQTSQYYIIRDATYVWGKNRKTENIYFCHQWPFPPPPSPNLLKTGVGSSVVQSCHSCLGEKRKIEKYVFLSPMALPCPPNPLKLSNPLQTVTSSIDKRRHTHGKNA